jgi:hypothetical protein
MVKFFLVLLCVATVAGCTTTRELKSPCVAGMESPCETREVNRQWT